MNSEEIIQKVKEAVLLHSKLEEENNILNDTDLVTLNIFDSIKFFKMISYLENEFKIKFNILELVVENFKSIEMISLKIEKKIVEAKK